MHWELESPRPASAFVDPVRSIFRGAIEVRTLQRHECRAPGGEALGGEATLSGQECPPSCLGRSVVPGTLNRPWVRRHADSLGVATGGGEVAVFGIGFWASGGIGRHAGLRIPWRKPCRFKSCLAHQCLALVVSRGFCSLLGGFSIKWLLCVLTPIFGMGFACACGRVEGVFSPRSSDGSCG